MKKIIVYFLFIGLMLCAGVHAGEMENIMAKGELAVSLNRATPPFCMETEGTLTGIDVDLARLMAETLGVKVRFILPEKYEEQIIKLLAGESDIIMAAMTRTPERGRQVNFSQPYFEVSQAALVRRDLVGPHDESYFDLADIKGLKVGVKQHTTLERFARELFPAEAVKTYADHEAAVAALLKGEVDATVHDSPFVRVWEKKADPRQIGKIKALLAPTTHETYGFAIRKNDFDFLEWINLFIDQVKSDGTMDLLNHRYFVEMPWLENTPSHASEMSKAQLLRNKFLFQKQEMLKRQRREAMKSAGAPY